MCDKAVFDALNEGMQTLYNPPVQGALAGSDGTAQGTFSEPPVVFWKDDTCATFTDEHSTANPASLLKQGVDEARVPDVAPWRVMYVPLGLDYKLDGQPYRAGPHLHRAPTLDAHAVTLRRSGGHVWNSVQADVCMGRTTLELAGQEVQLSADCDQIMAAIYVRQYDPARFAGSIDDDLSCYVGAQNFKSNPPQDRLPVVCFDATCAEKGYKSAEHLKDACSPPVCVKHIKQVASDVSTSHPTVYCGGIHYTFPPKVPDGAAQPTPTAPPETEPVPNAERGLTTAEWILIWAAILAAFVALALVVAFVGRDRKNKR